MSESRLSVDEEERVGGAVEVEVVARADGRAGVYVHLPFCARVCPYCDFAVTARRPIDHLGYARALIAELESRAGELAGRSLRTLYFGGGTPSLWSLEALGLFLNRAREVLDFGQIEEVSLEADPDDLSLEKLEGWWSLGVRRLSLGVQSFQGPMLEVLGQNHSAAQARDAVALLVERWEGTWSLDLMFGLPGQGAALWARDLEVLQQLGGAPHLSAYELTYEPRTPFYRRKERGELEVVGEDRAVEMLEGLAAVAAQLGLEQYEVSSWARGGQYSRHNSLYWQGGEYLGLGVGAHSLCIEGGRVRRRANVRHLRAYVGDPIGSGSWEFVEWRGHLLERLMTGIRSRRAGVEPGQLVEQFGSRAPWAWLEGQLEAWCGRGFLEREGSVYLPTREGLWRADALAQILAAELV